jgi:signal transduction histidine kinase/ActR/RegA family two-component response regulator
MIPAWPSAEAQRILDPFERTLAWRARDAWIRCLQASLVALLTWLSTGSRLAVLWLAVMLLVAALDRRISRHFLGKARTRTAVVATTAVFTLSATSFALVAPVLLSSPSPIRLAEAVLFLGAVSLNNALMSCGSRATMIALVGPASATLILTPILARLFGLAIPMTDVVGLAVAGAFFSVFIVRLADVVAAEGEALGDALGELARHSALAEAAGQAALESRHRLRLIFDQSPTARACFDASQLYKQLRAPTEIPPVGLGDVLRARMLGVRDIFRHVTLLEANQVAQDLCGGDMSVIHLTDTFVEGFGAALNEIGDDGALPPFPAELIRGDGSILDIEVHLRMSSCDDEPWSLCMAAYVDVTAARQATREQRVALEAAEVANRAKSEFLAVISHEIRTPLNGVLGMAQAMALSPLPRAQRERLRVLGESGEALMTIVDDLLDLARIEAGGLTLVSADFDLPAVLESVRSAYAAEAAHKGLTFTLAIDPRAAGRYRGDAGRLRQIISALVSNALKFTHRGEVSISLLSTGRGIRCEVRDSGIGIAADRIPNLFEKFVQADSSMTRHYGGAGLGLALCQKLSKAMGGEILVESAPGVGSTFALALPLPACAVPAAEAREEMVAAAERQVRVLAAEDNPVNQMVLRALLGQIGLEPTIVANGVEAVAAWEAGDWDLILMDVQMPLMDGLSAAQAIRAREAELGREAVPIIAVTANAMIHQVASYRAAGMTEVISKPIDVEALFSAMIAAIARVDPPETSEPYAVTG